jgi:hypothetical protein
MTKEQLIKGIQVAEAKAWKQLSEDRAMFGNDHNITIRSRAEWSTLYDLRGSLGLEGLSIIQLLEMDLLPDHNGVGALKHLKEKMAS